MEQRSAKPFRQINELTARDIRRIAKADYDRPSLLPYVLLVLFFLILDLAYYFFWLDLSRPVWEPLVALANFIWSLVR